MSVTRKKELHTSHSGVVSVQGLCRYLAREDDDCGDYVQTQCIC